LDFIVENEHKSSTGSSKDVGKASLEESSTSLISIDLSEAVHGTCVHSIGSGFTGSHHESSSDGIKWIRNDTSGNGDNLSETPLDKEMLFSVVLEEDDFTRIEHTEVRGSVGNDTDDGDTETVVELASTLLSNLHEAVNETCEFSFSTGTDIGSKSGSCEIEWVDEAEGSSTSSTTGGAVTDEEHAWLSFWVVWVESLLVEIFASEVQGLGWEITNDVSKITSPKGSNTLLGNNSFEAVTNTTVSLVSSDVLVGILDLKEKLDSLNWGNGGLGDGGGNTGDKEVNHKVLFLWWGLGTHIYLFAL